MSSKTTTSIIGIILGSIIVIMIVLRLTGVFPQVEQNSELIGTIGGVEKADKFVGEQMTVKDIQLEDSVLAQFVQSAEFQNLLKDPDFKRLLQSKDFQRF